MLFFSTVFPNEKLNFSANATKLPTSEAQIAVPILPLERLKQLLQNHTENLQEVGTEIS